MLEALFLKIKNQRKYGRYSKYILYILIYWHIIYTYYNNTYQNISTEQSCPRWITKLMRKSKELINNKGYR